jgi:hypothetical protein
VIREHQFRGNEFCTYKWHLTECGKPRSEHAEMAYDVVPVVPKRVHLWAAVVLRVHNVPTPAMACTRRMCFVKWWPNRGEPLGECQGL